MRKKCVLGLIIWSFCFGAGHSQTVSDSLRYAESKWSLKKKAIVNNFMDLSEAEKAAFWPIYESYSNASQYMEIESLSLLLKLDAERETLTFHEVNSISTRLLGNEVLMAKLRKQYFKKFKKALGAKAASEFMQFDQAFRTAVRLECQRDPKDIASNAFSLNLETF